MAEKKNPVNAVAPDPIAEFQPPFVPQGDWVEYSSDGRFETSEICQVSSVSGKSLNLRVGGGQFLKQGVRHTDDPVLKRFPEQRMDNGAWRLTPSSKRLEQAEQTLLDVVERLTALESRRA